MESLVDSVSPLPKSKPWYKRVWFIVLVILFILWFGAPTLLKLFGYGNTETGVGFTALPGSSAPSGTSADVATLDDPALGPSDAPVVIVEFGDFECPFCRQAAPIIKQLLANYPDAIKFIYRDFPVSSIHPQALPAAIAANCAAEQGQFWSYHDALYAQQDNLAASLYLTLARGLNLNSEQFMRCQQSTAVVAEIEADFEAGLAASVRGTPTWFVNGRKVEGALPYDLWVKIITAVVGQKFSQ